MNTPAFPTTVHNYGDGMYSSEGMTLRDYFAAKAMQAVNENFAPNHDENDKDWSQWVARISYQLADAMLEARK